MSLQRRWMLVLAGFALGVTLLFGLFAMTFVYTVEDRFLERQLLQEAERQRGHHARHGDYSAPATEGITLHRRLQDLPADLAPTLAHEPGRTEAPGTEGRHYHLLALQRAGQPPWLVAEVSQQLIVRPIRERLLGWLAGWGLATLALALLTGWLLARRVAAPLQTLARRVAAADPQHLPRAVAQGLGDDEVGAVGRAFDALLLRTRAFVEREQAFTRDASHELRTPLAVLRLSIERLQAESATPEPTRQALAAMHAATLLMEQTVQTLLLMAREPAALPRMPAEPVAVLPLAEQWVLAHADWLGRQALGLELALGRPDRMALPAPVLQLALASLLANAFAHGTAGGVVRVAVQAGGLCVSNPSMAPPADVGPPYAKGDQSAGFGLGLAILQRLLAAHGAQLALSHADGITRAWVGLSEPVSEPVSGPIPEPASGRPSAPP